MKDYQTYMDQVKFPAIAHLELMEALERGVPTRRRARRYPGWAAGVAACAALALFLGTALWWQAGERGTALRPGSGDPPMAAAQDTARPTATPAETDTAYDPEAYELVVPPLPEGYAFTDEALDLPNLTGGECVVICWDYAPDVVFQDLTAEQILSIFGTNDPTALATGMAMGEFTITGKAVTQDDRLLDVNLTGTGADGQSSFTLRLRPGDLPNVDEQYEGYATWTENGCTVNGYSLCYDSDGDGVEEYHDRVFFEGWSTGVYFEAVTPDFSLGQNLTKAVVGKGTEITGGGFELELVQSKHSLYLPDAEPAPVAVERIHPVWGSPAPQI